MSIALWLIWATYSSFPNISENKTESRSKNTRLRKILHDHVFYILFCIVFSDIAGNRKHTAAQNITGLRVIPHSREFRLLLKARPRVFSSPRDTYISNNLNTNKNLMVSSCKSFLELS